MSSLIDENCAIIREQGAMMTNDQMKSLFDRFLSELKKSNVTGPMITSTKSVILTLVNLPNKKQEIVESGLVPHPLLSFLRDNVLVKLLRQREDKDVPYNILVNLSMFYSNICRYINVTNKVVFSELLMNESLINEVTICFNEISEHGKSFDNPDLLKSLRYLLFALCCLEKKRNPNDDSTMTESLFLSLIKCLCSSYTIETIKGLEKNFSQKLSDRQMLLLSDCPAFIRRFSRESNQEQIIEVPRILLNPFVTWATNCHSNSISQCSEEMIDLLRHLNAILVRPQESVTTKNFDQQFFDVIVN